MKFSIFTPTYNRIKLLEKLYKYLLAENYLDMEWIVIDDGSDDGTNIFMEKIIKNESFQIKYIFQENCGKYMAFNRAIDEAQGEYFICIDSDDLYVRDAFVKLERYADLLKEHQAGLCFLSAHMNSPNEIIGEIFPSDLYESNLIDIVYKHHVYGDKGILHRTNILKKYRFPIIPSEKFVTETVLYAQISKDYTYLLINEVFELKDYQKNGLSNNYRNLMNCNPRGSFINYSMIDKFDIQGKEKIKNTIGLISMTFLLKSSWSQNFSQCNHKVSYLMLTPLGYLYFLCVLRKLFK